MSANSNKSTKKKNCKGGKCSCVIKPTSLLHSSMQMRHPSEVFYCLFVFFYHLHINMYWPVFTDNSWSQGRTFFFPWANDGYDLSLGYMTWFTRGNVFTSSAHGVCYYGRMNLVGFNAVCVCVCVQARLVKHERLGHSALAGWHVAQQLL